MPGEVWEIYEGVASEGSPLYRSHLLCRIFSSESTVTYVRDNWTLGSESSASQSRSSRFQAVGKCCVGAALGRCRETRCLCKTCIPKCETLITLRLHSLLYETSAHGQVRFTPLALLSAASVSNLTMCRLLENTQSSCSIVHIARCLWAQSSSTSSIMV